MSTIVILYQESRRGCLRMMEQQEQPVEQDYTPPLYFKIYFYLIFFFVLVDIVLFSSLATFVCVQQRLQLLKIGFVHPLHYSQ